MQVRDNILSKETIQLSSKKRIPPQFQITRSHMPYAKSEISQKVWAKKKRNQISLVQFSSSLLKYYCEQGERRYEPRPNCARRETHQTAYLVLWMLKNLGKKHQTCHRHSAGVGLSCYFSGTASDAIHVHNKMLKPRLALIVSKNYDARQLRQRLEKERQYK